MKSKTMAIILALLIGGAGIHKFYLGKNAAGVTYLLFCWTFIPMVLSWFDAISYMMMSREKFDERYNWLWLSMNSAHSPAQR